MQSLDFMTRCLLFTLLPLRNSNCMEQGQFYLTRILRRIGAHCYCFSTVPSLSSWDFSENFRPNSQASLLPPRGQLGGRDTMHSQVCSSGDTGCTINEVYRSIPTNWRVAWITCISDIVSIHAPSVPARFPYCVEQHCRPHRSQSG